MNRARWLFILTLALVDATATGIAFYLAYQLRTPDNQTFIRYVPMMLIHVFSTLAVFFLNRMYHRKRGLSHLDEFYAIAGAASVGTVTAITFSTLLFKSTLDYPRLMMIYAWFISVGLITLGRVLHTRVQWWLQSRGMGEEKVLIVGAGEVGRMILQKIRLSPGLGYTVCGFVDVNSAPPSLMGVPVLGKTEEIPRIIEEHDVDEVIVGLPEASHQEILDIINLCQRGRVGIKVFPDVFQIMASEVSIGDLGGLPLLTVRDIALRGWKLTLKRGMDVILGAIGLVLLSPLLLLVAVLIKLDSPGPVFFVQQRMGLDAKPFPMLKFRSMRQDAEEKGPGWTKPGDPRVTRLGHFIRRFSLDEFPQLINVLLGEMSLVGPRPEQPAYVEQFRQSIPRYMDRHREKAGVTGWAQVNGLRGDTSIAERTKYDLWYTENWSFLLDFRILIRTVARVFTDRNAY